MSGEELKAIMGSQSVVQDRREGYACLKCGRKIGKREIKVAVSPIEFPGSADARRRVVCAECFRKAASAYAHKSAARKRSISSSKHIAQRIHIPGSIRLAYS
ncbi:MAG: hypothetical protein M1164_00735 [Candidatus Marsarchaeota archaeon]|jgi:hypothetical protein|nr:hypothetical protein [Candidatus Marsarchaeota archaeon]